MYKLYKILPVFMQNILCSIYGYKESKIRFNDNFEGLLKKFIISDFAGSEAADQKKQLLINILLNEKKVGLTGVLESVSIKEIKNDPWRVLKEMPILTKQYILEVDSTHLNLSQAKKVVTSGTTGKALSLWKDKESIAAQWAIWLRHRNRFDVKLNDLSVNFTGKPVVPVGQMKPPYWRYNAAQKQYLISMQHINKETIHSIVEFLNSIKPVFYSGYPSIIAEISRLALDAGLKLEDTSRPRVVFCGAEKTLDYQKDSISKFTNAVITEQYGLTEGNCNFSKCEHGYYHEDSEFCHIEIIDGEKLEDGAVRGRLVGTAFYNMAMPLIRYDTGDIAIKAPDDFKCPCGRSTPVILSVDGRKDDYVVTPDGRHVMRFDYLFKDTFEALEAQVVQDKLGEVTIKAVLSEKGKKEDFERKVRMHFSEYIAQDMGISFDYVDSIPRSVTGKFKAVLNRLDER